MNTSLGILIVTELIAPSHEDSDDQGSDQEHKDQDTLSTRNAKSMGLVAT